MVALGGTLIKNHPPITFGYLKGKLAPTVLLQLYFLKFGSLFEFHPIKKCSLGEVNDLKLVLLKNA